MKENKSDDFARLIGYSVISITIIGVFFFTLFTFYYLYIIGGGIFVSWVLWQAATKENKGKNERIKDSLIGFLFGAGGVALFIGLIYGSKAPWN